MQDDGYYACSPSSSDLQSYLTFPFVLRCLFRWLIDVSGAQNTEYIDVKNFPFGHSLQSVSAQYHVFGSKRICLIRFSATAAVSLISVTLRLEFGVWGFGMPIIMIDWVPVFKFP